MGRKIPGAKHHGAKDPVKQQEKREEKIKTKINNRPSKEDFQEVPRSMQKMMEARQNLDMYQRKRKAQGDPRLLDSSKHMLKESWMPGMTKPLKPVPLFKQREGENQKAFFNRMHQQIDSLKEQRSYETKFKVEVQTDQHGGSKVVDAELDEVDALVEEKKRKKLLAKKGIVVKSKEEKRKARREREKMRKNKKKRGFAAATESREALQFDDFQDRVGFGEVVHAPPTIAFKNKKIDATAAEEINTAGGERKPGAKSGLLLAKKLNGGGGGGAIKKKKLTVKPSMAKQAIMEAERQRVVDAYRAIKAEKTTGVR